MKHLALFISLAAFVLVGCHKKEAAPANSGAPETAASPQPAKPPPPPLAYVTANAQNAPAENVAGEVNAFLIEQGGRFFLYNDQGDLIIAKLSPKGYEEVSRAHLLDTTLSTRGRDVTWCHPAFAGRCAFVRNDKELVCLSLAAEG